MGVSRTRVVLYGIKGKYSDFITEDCAEYESAEMKYILPNEYDINANDESASKGKFGVFSDGMCGEYSFLCYFLYGNDEGDWGEDCEFSIDAKTLSTLADTFKQDAAKLGIAEEDIQKAKLYSFYWYS